MNITSFKVKASDPIFYRWAFSLKDNTPYDRLRERNEAIMKRLFDATMSGEIKGFYLKAKEEKPGWIPFHAFHRSTKADNTIQYSVGWWHNGDLDPGYDVQMKEYEDMKREGYPHGIWEVIA